MQETQIRRGVRLYGNKSTNHVNVREFLRAPGQQAPKTLMFQYAFFSLSSGGNCTWATGSRSAPETRAGRCCGSRRDQPVSHRAPACSPTTSTSALDPHRGAAPGDCTGQSKAKKAQAGLGHQQIVKHK